LHVFAPSTKTPLINVVRPLRLSIDKRGSLAGGESG
jgi:hypothetical protein